LHTKYVDKPLDGIKAVQTLSRLNRTCRGKDDTFVLDFVNDPETIQEAFQTYYEVTGLGEATDPNILDDLQNELDAMQVYTNEEVDTIANLEYSEQSAKTARFQGKLNATLDPGVERYKQELEDEAQELFKAAAVKFVRTYAFILQIGPFSDLDLHKRFIYLSSLLKKLPKNSEDPVYISDDVALEYYRNEKAFDGSISLDSMGGENLYPTQHGGAGRVEEEKERLSSIIDRMNDRFGTDFTDADKLLRDQLIEDMKADEVLVQKAQSNTKENFKFSFERTFYDYVINRMQSNESFFLKILENPAIKDYLIEDLIHEVYTDLRKIQ